MGLNVLIVYAHFYSSVLLQIQIRFLSNSDVIALYVTAVPWLLSMSVSTYTEMSVAALLYCQVC